MGMLSNLHERMLPTLRGSNPQPPDHQSDANPNEPERPASNGDNLHDMSKPVLWAT